MSCCTLALPQTSPFTRSICIEAKDQIDKMSLNLSPCGKVKYQLAGRALALGACIVTLVEAVVRAVVLCFIALAALLSQGAKQLAKEQSQQCYQAFAASCACFQTVFDLKTLSQILKRPREAAPIVQPRREIPIAQPRREEVPQRAVPRQLTAAQLREYRVREGEENIRGRLEREYLHAQEQMNEEARKAFEYRVAQPVPRPEQWHSQPAELVAGYEVGICHYIGRRPTMEDEHIATSFEIQIGRRFHLVRLFGVFDGHGGTEASRYARDNIQRKLSEQLVKMNPDRLTDEGVWNALKLALVELNHDFLRNNEAIAMRAGSTAALAMILDRKLWTANLGDSRIVLDNGGVPEQLTQDQKPDIPRFLRGIEKRGGVMEWYGVPRLNGDLAVARALGDFRLGDALSSRCKVTMKPLNQIQPDSNLFIGCDGIFDVASTGQIVEALFGHRREPVTALAANMVYSAYVSRSMDNLSGLCLRFTPAALNI